MRGLCEMKNMGLVLSCVILTTTGLAGAWGPNDPTDANADPDGDMLGNLDEFRAGSDPMDPDTDGGGCWDGWEVLYGLDPTDATDDWIDSDDDGWINIREFLEGTNPMNPNTDNDGFPLDSTDPYPLVPDGRPPKKIWPSYPAYPAPRPMPIRLPPRPFPIPPEEIRDMDNDGLVDFLAYL
jgi:hypothetical protein